MLRALGIWWESGIVRGAPILVAVRPGDVDAAFGAKVLLWENQNACSRIRIERREEIEVRTQQFGNAAGWAIAYAEKDDFGRMAEYEAALMEIGVL
jgi:hypothetical protein